MKKKEGEETFRFNEPEPDRCLYEFGKSNQIRKLDDVFDANQEWICDVIKWRVALFNPFIN